ncbi:MAG: hypothetical protein KDI16_14050 [Halioglobus sp.]|nr:hypothetical protein [Halioglobus sp.]
MAGVETLKSLQQEQKSSGPTYQRQVHRITLSSYSNHYRRMLPEILTALTFYSNNACHRPVLDALQWLAQNRDNGQRYIALTPDVPVESVIRPKWRDIVVEEKDERMDMQKNPMPFDGKRLIFGGFAPLVELQGNAAGKEV